METSNHDTTPLKKSMQTRPDWLVCHTNSCFL